MAINIVCRRGNYVTSNNIETLASTGKSEILLLVCCKEDLYAVQQARSTSYSYKASTRSTMDRGEKCKIPVATIPTTANHNL